MKKAVVLLNMGGPSNLFEVETFLRNMFHDEHILRIKSKFLRKLVGGFIVNKRLKTAQNNYKAIGGKSPITSLTFSLIQKLNETQPEIFFTYAMRYTPPYAPMVAQELRDKGIEEVTLLPLYPQYSTTTTLSSLTDFQEACKTIGYQPRLHIIERFYSHPLFLQCIQNRILQTLGDQDPQEYSLLLSAHGLPKSIVDAGDPYQRECQDNTQILSQHLHANNLHFQNILLGYQSKIGPMQWISPSTLECIHKLKSQKLILYPLAFSIDNSETLYELDIELRKEAQKAGIKELLLCPCPNDSEDFIQLILDLSLRRNL